MTEARQKILKIPFACDATGRTVHVDDEHQAPYRCHECGRDVLHVRESRPYTRAGSSKTIVRRAHFSHASAGDCGGGLETSLHLWAKDVIESEMALDLPRHVVTYKDVKGSFQDEWTYHRVELEQWQDGIRPDIVLYHGKGRLNVEIRVTHAVDDQKRRTLLERGASCVEIDLSSEDFDSQPGEALRQAVLHHAPRQWITHQLQQEREAQARDEWVRRHHQQIDIIRNIVRRPRHQISDDNRRQLEDEIARYNTGPFIGRDVPGSHWFTLPSRYWQHVMLVEYLLKTSDQQGRHFVAHGPSGYQNGTLPHQTKLLPLDPDPALLEAAGVSVEEYGSPLATVQAYFACLAEEPDIEGAHPAAARILMPGETDGWIRRNPLWHGYIHRRDNELKITFDLAIRKGRKDAPDYAQWLVTPLERFGATPRQLSFRGDPAYYRLIARLEAIRNMHNGGWPVDDLLGVAEDWLRRKRREQYNRPYDEDGGCELRSEAFIVCRSSDMMRQGIPPEDILRHMAAHTHPTAEAAERFLTEPTARLGGMSPIEFAVDIPSLQHCIHLMPAAPERHRGSSWNRQRVW